MTGPQLRGTGEAQIFAMIGTGMGSGLAQGEEVGIGGGEVTHGGVECDGGLEEGAGFGEAPELGGIAGEVVGNDGFLREAGEGVAKDGFGFGEAAGAAGGVGKGDRPLRVFGVDVAEGFGEVAGIAPQRLIGGDGQATGEDVTVGGQRGDFGAGVVGEAELEPTGGGAEGAALGRGEGVRGDGGVGGHGWRWWIKCGRRCGGCRCGGFVGGFPAGCAAWFRGR